MTRSGRITSIALLFTLVGCGSDSGGGTGGEGGISPSPPGLGCFIDDLAGEPDLLSAPTIEPLQILAGSVVDFEVLVDEDTRSMQATLMDAWRLRPPGRPQPPSETVTQTTEGFEFLTFSIPIETTGRYYVDIELCGESCADARTLYTLNRTNAGEGSDAVNDPYERVFFRDGIEEKFELSCIEVDSVAVQ